MKNSDKDNIKESFLSNIIDSIKCWWSDKILRPIRESVTCLMNIWRWKTIICKDRWWDYSFMLDILLFKLKDIYEHWGTYTHYHGDYDDKKILEEMIKDLEWMIDPDNEFQENYDVEYKKRSKRFWGRMDRHHQKFWD